tara:strand:- start:5529 stop:5768 length:240 start_codon:yes stop_codon:yes gene_type:complete
MTQAKTDKPKTKLEQLCAALRWKSGRTLAELSEKFGWQPHTTRAALTRLRQAGHSIDRIPPKDGKLTRYRISADEGAET